MIAVYTSPSHKVLVVHHNPGYEIAINGRWVNAGVMNVRWVPPDPSAFLSAITDSTELIYFTAWLTEFKKSKEKS